MKRIILSLSLVFGMLSANAQTGIVSPEVYDNVYLGANIGANTNLAGNKFFPVNTTFSIRLGKDISPIFGVNLEATAWLGSAVEKGNRFDQKLVGVQAVDEFGDPMYDIFTDEPIMSGDLAMNRSHNFIRSFNLGLNSTVNLSNLFLGYNGAPRPWEISSIIGLGWGHNFAPSHRFQLGKEDSDFLSAKTGFDISYNFGDELEHQFYIEPAILWNLNRDGYSGIQMNKHGAFLQLALGYNYKFGCSYGGHNFKFIEPDRAEIDRLNRLLEECNNRPTKVEYVEKIVYRDREPETRTISIDNLKVVPFEQGKDYLTDDAKIDLNSIKAGSHVQIIGTASPEGSEERNQELSNNRANVVAEYLESRGVIVDSKEGRGVEGKTSNRLAIVYVIR
jgi:hypothetical protein